MAFSRIAQSGAELRTTLELPVVHTTYGSNPPGVSASVAKTGAASFTCTTSTRPAGFSFSSVVSIRANMFFSYAGLGTGATVAGCYFRLGIAGVSDAYVRLKGSTSELELIINGSVVDTATLASTGMLPDTFYQIGFAYYANATTGYASVYIEGVQVLTYTGNTGTGITAIYYGGAANTTGWTNGTVFDDVFVDGSASSETDACPPARYFLFGAPNAAGNYSQWTSSSGTNYTAVDETTPNDDSDYVVATSANLIDSYNTPNPTIPSGMTIHANIAVAYAKKMDAGFASTLALGFRESSTDAFGSDKTLTTTYAVYMERTETKPSSGAWDVTSVNSAEFAMKSTGSY